MAGPGHDHGHTTGHSHGHDHNHGAGASAGRLAGALAVTGSFLLVELLGAWWFDSLALLADAGHMFTDTAALAIALAAVRIGQRPADERRTFGYRRFEVLAAALNALLLFVVAGYILYEGASRLISPRPVHSWGMLGIAVAGLVSNLISMRILAGGRSDSLNIRGAYLEVWADMLGSLGVIVGAVLIMVTGWSWIDPVVAILLGVWVLPRTWHLLRDTLNILLQGVPRGVDLAEVRAHMQAVPGVRDVHDLHLWSIAGDDRSLTAHVTLESAADAELVRRSLCEMLDDRHGIAHTTIQTERNGCTQNEVHR